MKVKGEEVPLLADIYGLQQPLSGAAVRIGAGIARAILAPRMHLFSTGKRRRGNLGYRCFFRVSRYKRNDLFEDFPVFRIFLQN